MNTPEIISAVETCENYGELAAIRKALDEREQKLKAEFMAQAEAMGLACHDGNGKPRKRRSPKQHSED